MILQAIINGLLLGGIYSLVSIGLSLIFGVMDITNFAHGELVMLSMYAAYFLFGAGVHPYISLFLVIPLFFLIGVGIQKGLIQPVLKYPSSIVIILTFGISLAFQGLAQVFWTADFKTLDLQIPLVTIGDASVPGQRLIAFFIALILSGALYLFLSRTYIGKALRATSQNKEAASLMGISVNHMYMLAFGLAAAIAGAAGTLLSTFFYISPTAGGVFVTIAYIIVVFGGLGNLLGAFVGSLIIGTIESLSAVYIGVEWKEFTMFVLFILVLIFLPKGLFGKRGETL